MADLSELYQRMQRVQEKQALLQQQQALLDKARAAVAALAPDQKEVLLAELVLGPGPKAPVPTPAPRVEANEQPTAPVMTKHGADLLRHTLEREGWTQASGQVVMLPPSKKTKMDLAEELIRSSPGVTTRDVAAHIEQSPKVAGTTLNQIMKKRETIKNRAGKWYPVASPDEGTFRDAINEVLGDGSALGMGDIVKAVQARRPTANRNSVNGEIYRMLRTEPPLLVRRGEGERGALYALSSAALTAIAATDRARGASIP